MRSQADLSLSMLKLLRGGDCLNDDDFSIMTFDVKEEGEDLFLLLPEEQELDAILGTSKWIVKAATAESLGRNQATQIEIEGPKLGRPQAAPGSCNVTPDREGRNSLTW